MKPKPRSAPKATASRHPNRLRSFKPWLVAWLIIYAIIIGAGIFTQYGPLPSIIRVGGIFLCFVYAALIYPHDRLLILALFLTCLADLVLIFNNASILGLVIFFLAQFTHLFRLSPAYYRRVVVLYGLVALSLSFLALTFQLLSPLYVVCFFYGLTLAFNLFTAWRWRHHQPRNLHANLAAIGFTLFASCDLCTATSYLALSGVLPGFLYAPTRFFVWFFYYPSQILISNSPKYATIDPKEG